MKFYNGNDEEVFCFERAERDQARNTQTSQPNSKILGRSIEELELDYLETLNLRTDVKSAQ